MQCPDCKQELGARATYCPCGWKKATQAREQPHDAPVPCAHSGCGIRAMCRIRTATGWANLCWQHYDAHFSQKAIDNLDKYGMERQADETRAEHVMRMRKFVREGFKKIGKGADRQQALDALIRDFTTDLSSQP
jgi:hypothetical protein